MDRYSLQDAKIYLQQLISDAQHGKAVLIVDDNEQAVQLIPVAEARKPRRAGSARGLVKMAADFDDPRADFDEHVIPKPDKSFLKEMGRRGKPPKGNSLLPSGEGAGDEG